MRRGLVITLVVDAAPTTVVPSRRGNDAAGRAPTRRCSVRNRVTGTSWPHIQQARVGRRRPAASSQMGGVTG
jgi:hypothetical protein